MISSFSYSQYKNLNVKLGGYRYSTKFDTASFLTTLKIKKGSSTIFYKTSEFPITGISEYDLDNNGEKELLFELYSGGAHCCTYLMAARMTDGKFKILDTLYWGNSPYEIVDLDSNGIYEISGYNDIFAYAFTNYAQSQFSIIVYEFKKNKFTDVTRNFPKLVNENINNLKEELQPYMDTGYACQSTIDEDTFNTDAGAVKAILAPIVMDYFILGEVNSGYEYVNSVYKCIDRNEFMDTLRTVYQLK